MDFFRITKEEAISTKGEVVYVHNFSQNNSSAFLLNESAKIKIKLPRRLCASEVTVEIFDEAKSNLLFQKRATWCAIVGQCDEYTVTLPKLSLGVGLYFYRIKINTLVGIIYGVKHRDFLSFSDDCTPSIQLSVSDFKYNEPENLYGGIIYHAFVDRFAKGMPIRAKEGSVAVKDWSAEIPEYPKYPGAPLKNNYFYGGDLYGIIKKLDYLSSLGVSAIYLSPIFESVSNHKYDTADYMRVDSAFGGDEALRALIEEAKKYGIGIILDGVFNHTGADSIYFNRYKRYDTVGAYQSKDSGYYPWYNFKSFPDEYTCWWGIEILPRINPDIPQCRDYFTGRGGVIEKYAKMGVLGFRLDVVDELSDSFTKSIKERLNESNPSSVLYGEVWEDASNKIAYDVRKKYYLGEELDGVMNYPLREGLVSYLRNNETDKLHYALTDIINNAPARIQNMQMNLIGTHDTERIITVLGGESSIGKTNDYLSKKYMNREERELGRSRLLLAYTALATLPGVPSIYYADEVGLEGYSDPFNRRTYPWGNEDTKILEHYQKVGKIRRENDVYKKGQYRLLHLSDSLLIFARYTKSSAYITVLNNQNKKISISFSSNANALLKSEISRTHTLGALASEIFKVKSDATLDVSII